MSIVWTVLAAMAGMLVIGFVQATLRRRMDPYEDCDWEAAPAPARTEVERILPGFKATATRVTRSGRELRASGEIDGEAIRIEVELDGDGGLLEVEIERELGPARWQKVDESMLPEPVALEVGRVLGSDNARAQTLRVLQSTESVPPRFEIDAASHDWKWEIVIAEDGRLLEAERERRGRR